MSTIGEVSITLEADDKSKKALREFVKNIKEINSLRLRTNFSNQIKKDLDKANNQVKNFSKEVKKNSDIKLKVDAKTLNSSLQNTARKINDVKNSAKGIDEVGKAADRNSPKVTKLGQAAENTGRKIKDIGSGIQSTGQDLTVLTAPIIAGLGIATRDAIVFEDQLADIAKTSGATGEELEKIGEGIRRISRNSRTSTSELAKIAEEAGRLGIQTNEIVGFTEAIDQLVVALGDDLGGDAQQVTSDVTKLVNTFRLSEKSGEDLAVSISRVGSTINTLSASSSASAGSIIDFTRRLGAVASIAGISVDEVAALGATLDSLGVRTEVGATAVQQLLTALGKDVELFANVAGLSVEDFSNLLREDAFEALLLVSEGVGRTGTDLGTLSTKLDDLGINGARATEVLGQLSNNTDVVRKQTVIANKAFAENTSLLTEFETKNNTAAAALGKFRNALTDIGIEIGSVILPVLADFAEKGVTVVSKLVDIFSGLPSVIQKVSIAFGVVLAAIGPILIIVGKLVSVIGSLTAAFGAVAGAVSAPVVGIAVLVAAFAAAVAFIVARSGVLENAFNDLKPVIEEFATVIKDAFIQAKPVIDLAIDAFLAYADAVGEVLNLAWDVAFEAIKEIASSVKTLLNELKPLGDIVVTLAREFGKLIKPIKENEKVMKALEILVKGSVISTLFGVFSGIIALVAGFYIMIKALTAVVKAGKSVVEFFINFEENLNKGIERIGEFSVSVLNSIVDLFTKDIPDALNEGVKEFVDIVSRIGEFMTNALPFLIGQGVGLIIKTFLGLPSNILISVKSLAEQLKENFINIKDNSIETFNLLITSIIEFFENLPLRIINGLTLFINTVIEFFNQTKNRAILRFEELRDNVINFVNSLPSQVEEGLQSLVNKFNEKFQEVIDAAKNLVTSVVDELKSIPSQAGDFLGGIGGGFIDGVRDTTGIYNGGKVGERLMKKPRYFQDGGLVKNSLKYAQSGASLFRTKGVDTIPAMLQAGERVLNPIQNQGFEKLIKTLTGRRFVEAKGATGINRDIKVSIENLNANGKKHGESVGYGLGWGIKRSLLNRGII